MFRQFQSDNFIDCLDNEHFHSPDKGCELTTIENYHYGINGEKRRECNEEHCFNQKCITHNIICSKTGWALHHYNGQDNRSIFMVGTCLRCGKRYYSSNKEKIYCIRCLKEMEKIFREANNLPADKRKEAGLRTYLKRVAEKGE